MAPYPSYEGHICGNPECPRDHCKNMMAHVKAYIYASHKPDLPLMWYFRTYSIDYSPRYIDDDHICHMTRTPQVELLRAVRLTEERHRWIPFDPTVPFKHIDFLEGHIVLKCADIDDKSCFGLTQFVSKLEHEYFN